MATTTSNIPPHSLPLTLLTKEFYYNLMNLNPNFKGQISRDRIKKHREVKRYLRNLYNNAMNGNAIEIIKPAYRELYKQGNSIVNIVKSGYREQEYIDKIESNEIAFLEQLKDSLKEKLPDYISSLRYIYNLGYINNLGESVSVYWICREDNCKDCNLMSEYSPYNKMSLIALPGSKNTSCMEKCQCYTIIKK